MKLNNKIFKKLILITTFFSISFIILPMIINMYQNNNIHSLENDGLKGLGLFISNKYNDIHNQVIDYSHIDDYKYSLTNKTGKDLECNLNVFVNGKQTCILNTDSGQSGYNFKFSINDNDSLDVPIKLVLNNLQDGAYIVNFNIVSDYDEYAVDNNVDTVWLTSTFNYTFAIENNSKNLNIPENNNVLTSDEFIDNITEYQFIANYTKNDLKNELKPKNYIEAKPNTNINVPIVIGGSDKTISLLYATLDNNQIKINNSDTLVYNSQIDQASVIHINLDVPSQSGKYELLFYSLSNFKDTNVEDYGSLKFSPSHRITLKVE